MRTLIIDEELFVMAMKRDFQYGDGMPQEAFLERESGNILFIYDDDSEAEVHGGTPSEENRAARKLVAINPKNFLNLPGMSHGDHHQVLQEFLESNWTEDQERRSRVSAAYNKSIGFWIKTVNDPEAVEEYYIFLDKWIRRESEIFLQKTWN